MGNISFKTLAVSAFLKIIISALTNCGFSKNLIISKLNEYDGVYISTPNKPEEYNLIDGVLTLTDSNKEYVVNFKR